MPCMPNPTGRTSIDLLSEDAGESTVTVGGDVCLGVIEIMDCGLERGGLGLFGLSMAAGCEPSFRGVKSGTSPLPDEAVVGLEVPTDPPGSSHGERPPTTGEAGGVPLSLSKFSNLERSEDTGLIEEASGPSLELSMAGRSVSQA